MLAEILIDPLNCIRALGQASNRSMSRTGQKGISLKSSLYGFPRVPPSWRTCAPSFPSLTCTGGPTDQFGTVVDSPRVPWAQQFSNLALRNHAYASFS
jgi:hypothetical protein